MWAPKLGLQAAALMSAEKVGLVVGEPGGDQPAGPDDGGAPAIDGADLAGLDFLEKERHTGAVWPVAEMGAERVNPQQGRLDRAVAAVPVGQALQHCPSLIRPAFDREIKCVTCHSLQDRVSPVRHLNHAARSSQNRCPCQPFGGWRVSPA